MRKQHFQLRTKILIGLAVALVLGLGVGQNALAQKGVPDSFADLAEKEGHVAVNISTTRVVEPLRRFLPFQIYIGLLVS